ncbi:uncharacterized protein LOC110602540 [Manihot esculenta]|uniref:uncharacterized protein LOC110602540 n=1 Tax=Manihot esculenta TaxID=3983 RepID=UPI001CC51450|nr:uncharacterized protein LOC110602540 [Manihot esculenta]
MSAFAVVYRKISTHTVDLIALPTDFHNNIAANNLTNQHLDVFKQLLLLPRLCRHCWSCHRCRHHRCHCRSSPLHVGRNEVDNCIYQIAQGPSRKVQSYKGYFVNGFKFHRHDYGRERKTLNSGVWVKGSCYNEYESDYYGLLNDVLELEYFGEKNKIIIFKCEWFDTNRGVRVHPQHGLVEINVKLRLASSDPFILAQQAHQVCYIKYPKINKVRVDWCAVFKTKARSTYNIGPSMVNNNSNEQNSNDIAYQEDDVSRPQEIVPTTELDDPTMLLDSSSMVEVDVNELQQVQQPLEVVEDEDEDVEEEEEGEDEEEEEDTEESDDNLEVDGIDSDDDVNLEDDSE